MRERGHHGHAAQADDLELKGAKAASASRTSATWLRRTFTSVLPAKGSPTHSRPRTKAWSCAATGPTPARAAPSSNVCTTAKERLISRWEHEHVLEAVQRRLDEHPEKMRQRRETVEHPFGTIKARMGATHFLMKTLPRVATEMALHVLAYNLTRVMNIMGVRPLMAAMRA